MIELSAIVIQRGDLEIRIGDGGVLSFEDLAEIKAQHEERAEWTGMVAEWPLSIEHVKAILAIKRVFPDASILRLTHI